MGQQLSIANLQVPDLFLTNDEQLNKILSDDHIEDSHLFLTSKLIETVGKNSIATYEPKYSIELPITKRTIIKHIRNHLSILTTSPGLDAFNKEVTTLVQQVLDHISSANTDFQASLQSVQDRQTQLKDSLKKQQQDDKDATSSIFAETFIDESTSNNSLTSSIADNDSEKQRQLNQFRAKQLSFFAVQSLISMLLMLLQSMQKYDSNIVHQMLNLTNQLVEMIPLNYLSPDVYKKSSGLLKSLRPLTEYISEQAFKIDIDPIAAHQSIKILLNFSLIKSSLKDVLPIIRRLIFNTDDIYDIRTILAKLNKDITMMMDQFDKQKQTANASQDLANTNETPKDGEISDPVTTDNSKKDEESSVFVAVEKLKSIGAFPMTQLLVLDEKKLSGQFVSCVLLIHIGLHNQRHVKSKFEQCSLMSSFSFELGPETFKYLYEISEGLYLLNLDTSDVLHYCLLVCLQIFRTHLTFLIASSVDNFNDFLDESAMKKWYSLISKLATDDKSEDIKKEASKTLVSLIEKQTSFANVLALIQENITDNKFSILLDLLLKELSSDIYIQRWIQTLCGVSDSGDTKLAFQILHSFLDIVLKSSSTNSDKVDRLRKIMTRFQELLLINMYNQGLDVSNDLELSPLSKIGIEYSTHIIQCCILEDIQSSFLEPLLIGLCGLTEAQFSFSIVGPIFISIAPLLADHLKRSTNNTDDKSNYLLSWLLGKMILRLIIGPEESPLEKKYLSTLKLPLFAGGCETVTAENNSYLSNLFKSNLFNYSQSVLPYRRQQSVIDSELLTSIYNNTGQGAKLISKMKSFSRDKRILQKSVESLANDACAAIFAVYIKHFRRIELAHHELTQSMDQKPHAKILSLYEYANQVKTTFATIKGQGGDCNELCKQIRTDALVLLVSIKESSFIPTVKEDSAVMFTPIKHSRINRQKSHWTKAISIIRLLRNTLTACIKLKYLMLARKQAIEQKKDSESILHRAIATFLYGRDASTLTTDNEPKIQADEMVKCLIRQYQRAITRLMTYRFINTFMDQLLSITDTQRIQNILPIYLMNLKDHSSDWHYLNNIQASNLQLKESIGQQYYFIVKNLLSFFDKSNIESKMKITIVHRLFEFITLSYDSMDLRHLDHFQFIQTFYDLFVKPRPLDSNSVIGIDMKLAGFNWFRLFVLSLCDNIELEELRNNNLGCRKFHQILQKQCDIIFHKVILDELKQLQENQNMSTHDEQIENLSFKSLSIAHYTTISTFDTSACINQYLMLLLRCIHLYDYVRLSCATLHYIQRLVDFYNHSQVLTTRLLALKLLRDLLVLVPETPRETETRNFIENLLTNILLSIGQSLNLCETNKMKLDIIIELVYIYRTILSKNSPWQKFATKLLIDAMESSRSFDFDSVDSVDSHHMNVFLGSLSVLGGYVRPYHLGSNVEIYEFGRSINELEVATIIEINATALESDTSDVSPYLVQYAATNKTEWLSSNRLRLVTDVLPPNLLLLPIDNAVHIILDTLGHLAQINTSSTESLGLLRIKCCAITAFYPLLSNKSIIETFMDKPYATTVAKLSVSIDDIYLNNHTPPTDLRVFNRLHLEQYYLSLDKAERTQQIKDEELLSDRSTKKWNQLKISRDERVLQNLAVSASNNDTWLPFASEFQLESYKSGRLGGDEVRIVPFPANDGLPPLEECGEKHRFYGRINVTDDTGNIRYPSYIIDNLRLTEGQWYYCVKLPLGGAAQIGWATNGFKPGSSTGVGEDDYSWGYDGSRSIVYSNGATSFRSDVTWKEEDVCGCGIEIQGNNTKIKFWLNGEFLGVAISHEGGESTDSAKQGNLFPNGSTTSFFPAVTIQVYNNVANTGVFEFILSPEDMGKCPLPNGYKPVLMPKLLKMKDLFVNYPYSTYLTSIDIDDYFYASRCLKNVVSGNDRSLLRDLVNNRHIEVPFNKSAIEAERHLLKLSEESNGFLLSLDNFESMSISFDFETLSTDGTENHPDEVDIIVFAVDNEMCSIRISLNNVNDSFSDENRKLRQRVVILFQKNEQTKIYINDKYYTTDYLHNFDTTTNRTLNLHLLPYQNVGIQNIGVWKYQLSEENIRRLFTYGLLHVAADYKQLNKYQKQANTIIFTKEQTQFMNDIVVPMNKTFGEKLWEERKKFIDPTESTFFKSISGTNRSVVQLFGSKSYLVLSTANQEWFEYTIILDIFVPIFLSVNDSETPSDDEARVTLLSLDKESEIYITPDGCIHLSTEDHTSSVIKFGEDIRLLISVQKTSIQIYCNGSLELNATVAIDKYTTKTKRIDLFRENEANSYAVDDNNIRIQCQSITFWNKATSTINSSMAALIKSSECSLDELVAPPLSILSLGLKGIGYSEDVIKYVIEKYHTTNIFAIEAILREKLSEIESQLLQSQAQKKMKVLTRLITYDDSRIFTKLIETINESKADLLSTELDGNDTQDRIVSEKEWYRNTIRPLDINLSLNEWLQDRGKTHVPLYEDPNFKLADLKAMDSEDKATNNEPGKKMGKSLHYFHQQVPRKIYVHSRTSCERSLMMIYSRYIISHMLKVWGDDDQPSLFPLAKFGDGNFIVTLLRLMDYHHTCARTYADDTVNYTSLLTLSILKYEIKELLKSLKMEPITRDLMNTKAPLFYQLQKHVAEEAIRFISDPSLISINNYDGEVIDEKMLVEQSNLDFLLKISQLFLDLLSDFDMKSCSVDSMIEVLFPEAFIRILFELFLLVPTHRSKIFILQLFTTLVRASENFKLHHDIQQFVLQLFVESVTNNGSLSNSSSKLFKNAVVDIAFALSERQHDLIITLSECPTEARDLSLTIDIINALRDRSRQLQWPELLINQSNTHLGEGLLLTREMIDEANPHFNSMTDEQLMNFMNTNINLDWNPLPNESLSEFIRGLPAQTTPDTTKYGSYTCLCDLPSIHVQTRAKFIYLFNIILGNVLPMTDLSLPPGINTVTDQVRVARNHILFVTKNRLLQEALSKTEVSSSGPDVKFDTVKASTSTIPEETMFYQAYQQVYRSAAQIFRRGRDERVWSATFVGMHSTDAGGPYRDSLTRICDDICSTRLSLFILCPNGRTNSGSNRDRWIPNIFPPNRAIPDDYKHQYRFVGQLMGMALRTKNYLDLRFPKLFWKQLVQDAVTIQDIEAIDIQSFTIINEMEENVKQIKGLSDFEDDNANINCDYLFSSVMSELTFEVVSSNGQSYELVPGGSQIAINAANFEEYCVRYRQYRINEFYRQIGFIREGLHSIVPSASITLFTARELEQAVCGTGFIDIEMLKRHTSYNSDNENAPYIQRFWTVLSEMLNEEQRKLFLIFVWGRYTLPTRDEDFTTNFGINRLDPSGNVDEALPKSHTCYFSIDLPPYSTKEIMYERLNYAITYCSSIDNDGALN